MDQRGTTILKSVDKRLSDIIYVASEICEIPFMVTEGLRTLERQKLLVAQGRSKTMNSKHLTGLAVDIVPIIDGQDVWSYLDGKPLDSRAREAFRCIHNSITQAAEKLSYKVRWGNDWDGDDIEVGPDPDESFEDWPHYELRQ
jgi:peptidoglycan L-alanyl-D-glutamate endopeptidase CwlK